MDKHNLTVTVFLNLKEGDESDFSVLPLQFHYSGYTAFRQGVGSKFGPNQEVALEALDASVKLFPCQFASNPNLKADSDGSDDDFEEEEDEKPTKKKLKIPSSAKLICSFVERANKLAEENKETIFEGVR